MSIGLTFHGYRRTPQNSTRTFGLDMKTPFRGTLELFSPTPVTRASLLGYWLPEVKITLVLLLSTSKSILSARPQIRIQEMQENRWERSFLFWCHLLRDFPLLLELRVHTYIPASLNHHPFAIRGDAPILAWEGRIIGSQTGSQTHIPPFMQARIWTPSIRVKATALANNSYSYSSWPRCSGWLQGGIMPNDCVNRELGSHSLPT